MEETNGMEEFVMNRINEWELSLFIRRIRIALVVVFLAVLLIVFFLTILGGGSSSSSGNISTTTPNGASPCDAPSSVCHNDSAGICDSIDLPPPAFSEVVPTDSSISSTCHSASFFLYYKETNNVLYRNYRNNKVELDRLRSFMSIHCSALRSGKSHLSLISYLDPQKKDRITQINNCSLEANVMCAYLKLAYKLKDESFTFAIDTVCGVENLICVNYVCEPLMPSSNRDIYYTNSTEPIMQSRSVARYAKIPYVWYGDNSPKQIFRTDTVECLSVAVEPVKQPIEVIITDQPVYDVSSPPLQNVMIPAHRFAPIIGIKTNLLYWGGITSELRHRDIIPNLEAEWYICPHWSLNLDFAYAAFSRGNVDNQYWGLATMGAEPRFWLSGNGSHNGFYSGVYALAGTYDVKLNSISRYGHTGVLWESGLSLGYYLPLTSRWGMEAGVRYGYRSLDYDTYMCKSDRYYGLSTDKENKFRLTGIRLLVSYRLGKQTKK